MSDIIVTYLVNIETPGGIRELMCAHGVNNVLSEKLIRSTLQQTENYLWDNLKRYDSKKNGEY